MSERHFYGDEEVACTPGPDGSCAICADEGQEGLIVALRAHNMALVELDGRMQEVAVDLIEAPRRGDRVLVHLGFAIARLDGAEGRPDTVER